jgi:hypothetical protein
VPLKRYKNYLDGTNAKLGKEIWTGLFVGTCRSQDENNDNGTRLINYVGFINIWL